MFGLSLDSFGPFKLLQDDVVHGENPVSLAIFVPFLPSQFEAGQSDLVEVFLGCGLTICCC